MQCADNSAGCKTCLHPGAETIRRRGRYSCGTAEIVRASQEQSGRIQLAAMEMNILTKWACGDYSVTRINVQLGLRRRYYGVT